MDLQSRVEKYVGRTRSKGAAKIEVTRPQWGRHSEVFLLKDSQARRSVLRAFRWPGLADRYASALRELSQRGLPLPGYLWHDTSLRTRIRYRRCFCAEQFADGRLMVDAGTSDATLEALLRSLASLHDERSYCWGRPGDPQTSDYRSALREECRSYLKSLRSASPIIQPGDLARWEALVTATWERLPAIADFSLVHGKLGADDIVIAEDGKTATFIDLASLSFGHYAHDLQSVLYEIARVPTGEGGPLVDQYLGYRRSSAVDLDYAIVAPFFSVRHHLRKLAAAHRRIDVAKLPADPRASFHYAALVERARGV